MKKEVVLVFQKNEVLGKVKTRLASEMGEARALEIYRHLVQSTYSVLEHVEAPVWTYFSDFIPETVNPPIAKSFVQDGQDLGERMAHAFARSFESGMDKVVLIGTDCPTLQSHHLHEAFEALTPGRQRAYNLFFTAAKQSATRCSRIDSYTERILNKKGINDCVCGLSKRMPGCDGSHKQLNSLKN
jgi:2-phospho-L-lactate guanylyltransferase (CobY/MobA/RfbA family)